MSLNVAILSYSSAKYKSNRLIIEAGKNHNVFVINPNDLVFYLSDIDGKNRVYLKKKGVLEQLPRIDVLMPRLASQISLCANIIDFFASKGVFSLMNGDILKICSSKWRSLVLANNFNIKVPKTFLFSKFDSQNIDTVIQSLKFPVILKLLSGSQGVNVMKFSDKSALLTTAETFQKQGTAFILQQMIKTKGKRQSDVRAITVGNKCVASMKKTVQNSNSEFRSNLSLNGKGESYVPSERELIFISKVCDAFAGAVTLGIDYIIDENDEIYFLEANSNYGTKFLQYNENFFVHLFAFIELEFEKFKKSEKTKSENQKETNILYEVIENLKSELTKKENLISEILENERIKSLFNSLKGKSLSYIDTEKIEKEIKITKPKQIIEMMTNMLEIEK